MLDNLSKEMKLEKEKEDAQISRGKFAEELNALPKIKPLKLILIIGWALAMAGLDVTIVGVASPNIMMDSNFVPLGSMIPQATV